MSLVLNTDKEFTAFVTQVLCNPLEDACKLAFADWLQDRDDPRGPLLRVVHNVKAAAGPYEPFPQPKRSKIRDSHDPTKIRTGPVPADWKYPYPADEFIPDITVPKLPSRRGAHGPGRLLILATVWDHAACYGGLKKIGSKLWSALTALELYNCRLITGDHRDHVIDLGYDARAYEKTPYAGLSSRYRAEGRAGSDCVFRLVRLAAETLDRTSWPMQFSYHGSFGSFVCAIHQLEMKQFSLEAKKLGTSVSGRQIEWHLRTRSLRMVDAWKAMKPWEDGLRVYEAKEELKQNSPPRSDDHKKHQISCGKYACDHKGVDRRTAYQPVVRDVSGANARLVRCSLCGHERNRMPPLRRR